MRGAPHGQPAERSGSLPLSCSSPRSAMVVACSFLGFTSFPPGRRPGSAAGESRPSEPAAPAALRCAALRRPQVSGILDAFVYQGQRLVKKKMDLGKLH